MIYKDRIWGGRGSRRAAPCPCALGAPGPGVPGTGVAAEIANPSFLAIHPTHKYLYAAGEISDFQGKKSGAVSAFSIDQTSGRLTLLNQQSSGGAGPCWVTVDATGKDVMIANYAAG